MSDEALTEALRDLERDMLEAVGKFTERTGQPIRGALFTTSTVRSVDGSKTGVQYQRAYIDGQENGWLWVKNERTEQ